MRGLDILKALNDLEPEMLEAAEKCEPKKKRFPTTIVAAAALCLILFGTAWQLLTVPITVENQYIRLEDAYLLSAHEESESVIDNLEREETQEKLPYVVEDGVVQMQPVNGVYDDALVPQIGIGTNGSTYLKKAIRELSDEEYEEEIKYLVEIEIYVPHAEYPDVAWYADNEIYKAEYKRLTEECGYDLSWIAPGGYSIPDAYVYCLKSGIIYGALTEEEMNTFPIKEEYSYGFRLISYDTYSFAEYPYKETYTSMEEFRHHMIALKALREAGESNRNEEKD